MKRVIYLVMVALVAMLILVPTAMAQEDTMMMEKETTVTMEGDLPKSGGVLVGSIVLPAAALLVGGGIVGYAVLRRR